MCILVSKKIFERGEGCIRYTIQLIYRCLHAAVTCPSLPDPSAGRVLYGSRDYTSVATYTCDFGYELFGSVTRRCQASGVWSGPETTCQRM